MHSESISSAGGGICDFASCPRATLAFVGRELELARIAGGLEGPLAAVEAARQLCAAGDHDAALAFIAAWHGPISGAGLDHLLLGTLAQLRAAQPGEVTPITSLSMGIARWAEGDARAAELALRDARGFLQAHDHKILGLIAGHYLARVLAMLGDVLGAVQLFAETTRCAREIGCESMTDLGDAYHAHAVLTAGGDLRTASAIAERVLAVPPADRRGASPYSRMLAHQALSLARAYEGDLAAARGHVTAALELSAAGTVHRIDTLLVRAEVELCGGDVSEALRAASIARNHDAECGRRYREAYACVVLAAGHAAHGGPGDLAMAEEALARGGALAADHGFEVLRLRAILVRAAVLCRKGDRMAAEPLLTEVLAHGRVRSAGLELLFASALGSQRDHELAAGLAAHLAVLGLRQPAAPQPEVVVDVAGATITTRRAVVKGRSIACALLACLADARGEVVPPDVLYRAAWEATEYHPLRDRNRLYVAVKRLRTTLTELCGDDRGALIETRSGGWRLAAGVVTRKTS